MQDFSISPNTSSSVEKSSINSHNVTDEDNQQVKSSREQMKEMLANRRDKKLTKKIEVDKGKKSSHESDLDFRERILARMEKQENYFNETTKGLQQNVQVFTHTISNAF